ncbi:hypothetical protein AOQ84DRAFT_201111 [Glonium stellatum]|uniref:Apple domain-containing protein n=1 Tax=Glonium stellatum TaxID=574774 RepID=A0A8E2JVG7_9PEZI|nr:hypothetical protein AOQ84DRAFT_201111 [Glonium stellatum]
MLPSTVLLVASSFISLSSCLPTDQILSARAQVCGNAPSGSNTQQAVLSQPSGAQDAAACQSDCDANSSCQSFVFGMVDNTIKCLLYACAASAIPTQTSTNLIAYDKACASVPTVTPTASNPTGANTGANTSSNQGSSGSKSSPGGTTPTGNRRRRELVARKTCGGAPSGQSNAAPISTPADINTVADCKAKCAADASCQSFSFGTLTSGGGDVCRLYAVPAASVPAPASGQSLAVYDVGCSV